MASWINSCGVCAGSVPTQLVIIIRRRIGFHIPTTVRHSQFTGKKCDGRGTWGLTEDFPTCGAVARTCGSLGESLSHTMSADFVIRECSVHFGDGVLGHSPPDTGRFLALTAMPARIIVP